MYILNVIKIGNKISHYDVLDEYGRQKKYTKEQVIDEINKGRGYNCRLQIYQGKPIIRITKPYSEIVKQGNKQIADNTRKVMQEYSKQSSQTEKKENRKYNVAYREPVKTPQPPVVKAELNASIAKTSYADLVAEAIKSKDEITGQQAARIISEMEIGTPFKIRTSSYDEFKQVIYCGITEVQHQDAHIFFNGEGVTGTFALTSRFIINNPNEIAIKVNDNEPEEVNFLLNYIKKGPFGLDTIAKQIDKMHSTKSGNIFGMFKR